LLKNFNLFYLTGLLIHPVLRRSVVCVSSRETRLWSTSSCLSTPCFLFSLRFKSFRFNLHYSSGYPQTRLSAALLRSNLCTTPTSPALQREADYSKFAGGFASLS